MVHRCLIPKHIQPLLTKEILEEVNSGFTSKRVFDVFPIEQQKLEGNLPKHCCFKCWALLVIRVISIINAKYKAQHCALRMVGERLTIIRTR